jgi:hypothetical protein
VKFFYYVPRVFCTNLFCLRYFPPSVHRYNHSPISVMHI